jgi:hypothetical protein
LRISCERRCSSPKPASLRRLLTPFKTAAQTTRTAGQICAGTSAGCRAFQTYRRGRRAWRIPGGGGPALECRLPLGHQRTVGTLCAAYVALCKSQVCSPEAPTRSREPETRDSSRSLLPEGADHSIRLIYGKKGEPTSGLEPLSCSLRVSCSTAERGPQTFLYALARSICWVPSSVSRSRNLGSERV